MNEEFNTSAQSNNQSSEEEMKSSNSYTTNNNDTASMIKDVLNGENGPLYVAITAILAVFGIHSLTRSRYSFKATSPDGIKYSIGPSDVNTEEA